MLDGNGSPKTSETNLVTRDSSRKIEGEVTTHWIIVPATEESNKQNSPEREGNSGGCENSVSCVHIHLIFTFCQIRAKQQQFGFKLFNSTQFKATDILLYHMCSSKHKDVTVICEHHVNDSCLVEDGRFGLSFSRCLPNLSVQKKQVA